MADAVPTNGAGTAGVVGATNHPPPAKDLSWGEYVKAHPPDPSDDAAEQQQGEPSSSPPEPEVRPAASPPESAETRQRDDKGRFLPLDEAEKAKIEAKPKAPQKPKAEPAKPKEEPPAEVEGRGPATAETLVKARKLFAEQNGYAAAHKLVFGRAPEDMGVNSKQWEAFRFERAKARREHDATTTRLNAVVKQVQERYAPYVEAEELLAKGDVEAWVKKATGGKMGFNELSKRALKQYTEEPASVKELRAELDATRAELREFRDSGKRERETAAERQRENEAYEAFETALKGHDDTRIAKLAKKPAFVGEVIKRVHDAWNTYGDELDPADVASEVFAEEFGELFEDSPVLAEAGNGGTVGKASGAPISAASKQSGAVLTPARRAARSTTLPLTEAAEVVAPIPERDTPERERALREKYTRLMRNSVPGE